MFSKNAFPCSEMPKVDIRYLFLVLILCSCSGSGVENKKERPMVYEGMPVNDLTLILGKPDSIQTGGSVFNADYNKNQKVEKWYYDVRTVVLIDDTVKTTNLEER